MQILGLEQMFKEEKMVKEEKMELKVGTRVPEEPVGWLEVELPKFVMSRLWSYIEEAKKNPIDVKKDLAGNISKSLDLKDKDDWFFTAILIPLINKFLEKFPSYKKQIRSIFKGETPWEAPCCLDTLWVNFQKENEFNPPHNHSGLFSFVIWVKIPTD